MENQYTMKRVLALAEKCILLGEEPRPEVIQLNGWHDRIRTTYHLRSKKETDQLLYERMYGSKPKTDTEYLKIRYWRTGKYMPENRKICLLLGQAMELSPAETAFLIQGYYDRSLDVYDSVTIQEENCLRKQKYLREIIDNYLANVSKERLDSLQIPEKRVSVFFRHLYFTDALHYIDSQARAHPDTKIKHITSSRYESELTRQMQLCGEIPRRVFIRHLLILGMPELTLEKLNQQLRFFGYLELNEEHTLAGGERLDWLLIHLLRMYEKLLDKEDPQTCLLWFQKACRTLDEYFKRAGYSKLRFMHFKSLDF